MKRLNTCTKRKKQELENFIHQQLLVMHRKEFVLVAQEYHNSWIRKQSQEELIVHLTTTDWERWNRMYQTQ
jgi:hypothetical protein